MSGWVKLYRKSLESKNARSLELTGFFSSLLLMASYHESKTPDGTELRPGQLIISQVNLADRFMVSRGKIQRLLAALESDQQISIKTSSKNTIISITNWDKYQGDALSNEHQIEQQTSIKRASNRTHSKKLRNKEIKNINTPPMLFEVEPLQLPEDIHADELPIKILTAFNAICDKSLQPTAFNLKMINARIKDGYKYEDFVMVFKHKQQTWGNDPKMRPYLVPGTIFNGKFDGYLEQAKDALKPKIDPLDAFFEECAKNAQQA